MSVITIAIAQFRPRKGDLPGNIRRVGEILAQAAALTPSPHVVQFPETVLSGYFVEGGVRELSLTTAELARALAGTYSGPATDVVIGFYERLDGNSNFDWLDVVKLVEDNPELAKINSHVVQKAVEQG